MVWVGGGGGGEYWQSRGGWPVVNSPEVAFSSHAPRSLHSIREWGRKDEVKTLLQGKRKKDSQ